MAQLELLGLTLCNNQPSWPALLPGIVSVRQSVSLVSSVRMNDDIAGEGRGGRIMPDECWGSQIMSSDLVLLTVAPGWRGGQTSDISQQDNNYFSI